MKFTLKFDKSSLDKLVGKIASLSNQSYGRSTANTAGKNAVDKMKELIGDGISPIYGKGKFPPYKESYKQQIKGELGFFTNSSGQKIPYKPKRKKSVFDKKTISPVNLELTGKFLDDLKAVTLTDNAISIGYRTRDSQLKEEGHATGANSQLKRPTIPQSGQRLAKVIEDTIADVYVKELRDSLSKL